MIIDQGLQQGGVQVAECGVDGWRESEQGRMGGQHKPHHSAPPTATASAPFANCPRPHSASLRLAPRFRGEGEGGAGGWGARSEAKHGRFGIDDATAGRPPPRLARRPLPASRRPNWRQGSFLIAGRGGGFEDGRRRAPGRVRRARARQANGPARLCSPHPVGPRSPDRLTRHGARMHRGHAWCVVWGRGGTGGERGAPEKRFRRVRLWKRRSRFSDVGEKAFALLSSHAPFSPTHH